jgi:DNA polymerase III subunit alpha
MMTKRGKPILILGLSQGDSSLETIAFPEKMPEEMTRFGVGDLVLIEAEVSIDPVRQQPRTSVQKILSQNEARKMYAQNLNITLTHDDESRFDELKTLLELNQGPCPVIVSYQNSAFAVSLKLSQNWRVEPTSQLLNGLKELLPQNQIHFKYGSKPIQ